MKADSVELEALATLHGEQGFLILNSINEYEFGHIMSESVAVWRKRGGTESRVYADQPVTITAAATREEFLRQNRRLDELLGTSTADWCVQLPYFYKVVATD